MSIEEFETPEKPDYPRANGAPIVLVEDRRIRMSRPSGFAKPLDDESALTNWRIDTACFGVAGSRELQARYVSTKRDDRKAIMKLREDAIQMGRGTEAAGIGTAIHAMSERWEDVDDDFNPPEPYFGALTAYTAEMERLGLVSTHFEVALVNCEYNAAGHADRIYQLTRPLVTPNGKVLERGTNVIGDIKTSKTLDYSMGSFACQMALYSQGELYDVINETFLPTPVINQQWGIIAWMPSNQEAGQCQMIWVDLDAGNNAAWLASLVKEHRRFWRQASVEPVQSPLDDDPPPPPDTIPLEDWLDFIRRRMATIGAIPAAKDALVRHWPKDVPSPKNGLHEMHDIEQVLKLLEDVEAEFTIGFPEGDPRASRPHTKKGR